VNEEEPQSGDRSGDRAEDYSGLSYVLVPVFYIGAGFALLAALFSTNSPDGMVASILVCGLFIFLARKIRNERKKSTVMLYLMIGLGLIALTCGLCVNDWHTFTFQQK
jgi:hypothetical protein